MSLFPSGPGLPSSPPVLFGGAGCQTKVAPLLKMVSFHLPAGMHPTTFLHCHLPLLWIFYPISKSFSVWHALKYNHTGKEAAMHYNLPSSITWRWVTSLQSKHESLPPSWGRGVGSDTGILKNILGPDQEKPLGHNLPNYTFAIYHWARSFQGPLPLCVCSQNEF